MEGNRLEEGIDTAVQLVATGNVGACSLCSGGARKGGGRGNAQQRGATAGVEGDNRSRIRERM